MQSVAYISSSPLWLAADASEEALNALVELVKLFNSNDGYSAELSSEPDGSYRLEMETQDICQESISGALEELCEFMGPTLAQPLEIMLRVDEMNDERDRYFYAAAEPWRLDTFKAKCRIERAIACLGREDFAARDALQQILFLVEPPTPEVDPERPGRDCP